jgi:hypothetical protein
MKTRLQKSIDGTVTGYSLNLSSNETYEWAHKSGAAWPCSTLSGSRLRVDVDSNGLCDIAIDGQCPDGVDGTELDAIVSDHLKKEAHHLWPCWA